MNNNQLKPVSRSVSVQILSVILLLISIWTISCNDSKSTAPKTETEPAAIQEVSTVQPASPPAGFKHQTVKVNGINLHYVIGGEGAPLVLIHGFGQNWYMWNRLLPELSKHFTVIAPDLRGSGESDKPAAGYDKKTMATDVHELVKQLGYDTINLAGHDIGLMVAYAYAAQFGNEVKKLALLDALIPGVEPVWTKYYTTIWHFGFFARPIAGDIVAGHEREFLTDFWPQVGFVQNAFTKEEADEFIRAFAVKGATTGNFHWFGEFPQDVKDNEVFMKKKLSMPVLAMGGEKFSAPFLATHTKLVANNVSEVQIAGAGHWIVQEQTEQVKKGLLDFFTR